MPEYTDADTAPQAGAPSDERFNEPMTEDEISASLQKMIVDAQSFIDDEVSPLRAEATEYYQGQPFGNEEKGRSQVVMTTVRDAVTTMLPSMMRAVWGPERKVEFAPVGPEDVAQAEQETDYINDVVMTSDNPGFSHTYAWLKDGLVRTTGVVKWWWDESKRTEAHSLSGATEEQLLMLAMEKGVEITSIAPYEDLDPTGMTGQMTTLYNLEFTRTEEDGRARWEPVPPEEILWNRDARDFDEAMIVVHRMRKTTTELLEMGIPQDVIDEHGGESINLKTNEEAITRNPLAQQVTSTNIDGDRDSKGTAGPNDYHTYYEAYPRLDVDGDGKAELRKICLLGNGYHVVENVPAPERPFSLYVPDPEPHTVLGLSIHDYVADLQRIESFVFRGALDSLALTLNPRYEVVDDQVSVEDVLNHELGAIVRVRQPNMVRVLEVPFVGQHALPLLEHVQGIKENRLGVSRAAAGLNPDALQSSTKAAVAATVTAAQQRIELFTRIFAETAFKNLMRGLRRLIIRHQPRARMVRLRGKYVEVDPRTWNADRDVHVNVTLGLGMAEDKLAVLGAIAADQKEWIDKFGPANPLTGLGQFRNTMARILKLQGYPNADEFYNPLPPDWQPPPAPEPPPDPALLVAQAEVAKTQKEIERMDAEFALKERENASKLEFDRQKLAQESERDRKKDDLERDKLDADIRLQAAKIEAEFNAKVDVARIMADVDRDRESTKARTELSRAEVEAQSAVQIARAEAGLPEPTPPAPPPAPPAPKRKRVTTRRDKDGNLEAILEEIEDGGEAVERKRVVTRRGPDGNLEGEIQESN